VKVVSNTKNALRGFEMNSFRGAEVMKKTVEPTSKLSEGIVSHKDMFPLLKTNTNV
jgi:hypothetical protein